MADEDENDLFSVDPVTLQKVKYSQVVEVINVDDIGTDFKFTVEYPYPPARMEIPTVGTITKYIDEATKEVSKNVLRT